jgi:prepilin-type N-terminal cleavage/methylation domain-containing protein
MAPKTARTAGMTIVELMVAVSVGSIVLAAVGLLFLSSLRNFIGLGNYALLTGQSRLSLDVISKAMREATQIVSCETNLPVKSLTLTNAFKGTQTLYSWDSTTGIVTAQTGQSTRTLLSGCDGWDFSFYQRSPNGNWTFFPTSDPTLCKLINMSWTCSRSILGRKMNTEDVVTAQVVLRNKP